MPQLSQQPTSTAANATPNRTRSPVYLDIENHSGSMMMNETGAGASPNNTMVRFDNFDDDVDVDEKIIRSAKGQLIDFNLFYENLLANHNHNHHHHHNHHRNDLYALNSATFFNESLNYCLNKVCNGKHHHQQHQNHHQNAMANNNENHNNSNNKSFSIDSILGFAAAAAVARNDIVAKDPINDDVVLYGHQTKMHRSMAGNQTILANHQYHHHHHHQTTISAKKLSNEEQQQHHHHHHHPNCLKQNADQKLKGCNNNNNNKKIGANKKCMKATVNNVNNNGDKNFGHNVGNKSKRVRTIFTPEQLERLENEFEKQQYMVGTGRLYLASTLNLTEAQVKVWFQNRRIKWRKQHLEGYQDNVPDTIKDEKMIAEHVDRPQPTIMAT